MMDPEPAPPEVSDWYAVLGLRQRATNAEVQRTYKTLMRKYHPDSKLPDAEPDAEMFKAMSCSRTVLLLPILTRRLQIGNAYAVLGSPIKRQKYDLRYFDLIQRWNTYDIEKEAWEQRRDLDIERSRARAEQQQKRAAEEAEIKRAREKQRLRQHQEELRRQWQEAQREAELQRAQNDQRIRQAASEAETAQSSQESSLRKKWLAAQERSQEQAQRAAEAIAKAARERLRKEAEEAQHHDQNEDPQDESQDQQQPADETRKLQRRQISCDENDLKPDSVQPRSASGSSWRRSAPVTPEQQKNFLNTKDLQPTFLTLRSRDQT
jgi:hypothetical protein